MSRCFSAGSSAVGANKKFNPYLVWTCAFLVCLSVAGWSTSAKCESPADQKVWTLLSTQWDNGKLLVNFRCEGKQPEMSITAGDPAGNESKKAKALPGQLFNYFKTPKQPTGYTLSYFGVSSHPSEIQLRNDLNHVPISGYLYIEGRLSATIPGIKPNARGRYSIHCQASQL